MLLDASAATDGARRRSLRRARRREPRADSVLVVTTDPYLRRVAFVATPRRPVEKAVEAEHELETACRGRVRVLLLALEQCVTRGQPLLARPGPVLRHGRRLLPVSTVGRGSSTETSGFTRVAA